MIKMEDNEVTAKKEVTSLSITFETNMRFKKRMEKVKRKMRESSMIISVVANRRREWDRDRLVTVYKTMVESKI